MPGLMSNKLSCYSDGASTGYRFPLFPLLSLSRFFDSPGPGPATNMTMGVLFGALIAAMIARHRLARLITGIYFFHHSVLPSYSFSASISVLQQQGHGMPCPCETQFFSALHLHAVCISCTHPTDKEPGIPRTRKMLFTFWRCDHVSFRQPF